MEIPQKRVVRIDLDKRHGSIRFTHEVAGFDMRKVCTLVGIYYDDEKYPDKEFFLENQKIIENSYIMQIEESRRRVSVSLETRYTNNNLEKIKIESQA